MSMLPLPSNFPISFRDPMYGVLARQTEQRLGLPAGILDAIRTRGERSNADQVSSAQARGPYQFIPSTRNGFIREYGIDPWESPQSQTLAAGKHILEDYKRTGSWDQAIARYHGGQRPGATSYKYAARVGEFDKPEEQSMPVLGQSRYPYDPYYSQGPDPLAPEPPKQAAPIMADAGPSVNVPAGSPVLAKKRGGILGALESVFMPDPHSLYAAALRGGVFDAKSNQAEYLANEQADNLKLMETQAKLKNLLTKGEYQVVGNNVFHIRPDGSTEIIAPPTQPGDKERLIDQWRRETDPTAKDMIARMLLGGNAADVIREKGVAQQGVAKVRSSRSAAATKQQNPPAGFRLDP